MSLAKIATLIADAINTAYETYDSDTHEAIDFLRQDIGMIFANADVVDYEVFSDRARTRRFSKSEKK